MQRSAALDIIQAAAESPMFIEPMLTFVISPLGDPAKKKEFLNTLADRDLTTAELDALEFNFVIAFYFLAWLAITTSGQPQSTNNQSIEVLHRRLYDHFQELPGRVRFVDHVKLDEDRTAMAAAIPGASSNDDMSALTTSKATMFDVLGSHWLQGYFRTYSNGSSQNRFYLVAQELLARCGLDPHPVLAMTLAGMLMGNLTLLIKLIQHDPTLGDSSPRKGLFRRLFGS
jgi:hypothetical protein